MKHALTFIIFHVAALLCCAADDPAAIQATSSSPIHPVLIRNEHGPMVRIVLDTADATDVDVQSVEFRLHGTDEPAANSDSGRRARDAARRQYTSGSEGSFRRRLEVWPGMFHVFQSHDPLLPEARAAIEHIVEFMRSRPNSF